MDYFFSATLGCLGAGDRQFLNSRGANSRCAARGLKKLIAEAPNVPRVAEKGRKRPWFNTR